MNYIEGNLIAQGLKIGIAAARFNEFIVSKLVSGAEDGLQRHGVKESDIDLVWVDVYKRQILHIEKQLVYTLLS